MILIILGIAIWVVPTTSAEGLETLKGLHSFIYIE